LTGSVEAQAGLEGVLKDAIIRMYQDVEDNPEGEFHFFHFFHGPQAAEMFRML